MEQGEVLGLNPPSAQRLSAWCLRVVLMCASEPNWLTGDVRPDVAAGMVSSPPPPP